MKNANRKGRKLGAYGKGHTTPCYVCLLADDELREMAAAMVPTTPLEHHMTRALLDVPLEWLTMDTLPNAPRRGERGEGNVTDTDKTLAPALSADEWREYTDPRALADFPLPAVLDSLYSAGREDAMMAILNHALPEGHPRKLTEGDAGGLDRIADVLESDSYVSFPDKLRALATKLRSILPARPGESGGGV